jgi:hypothetical protein
MLGKLKEVSFVVLCKADVLVVMYHVLGVVEKFPISFKGSL